MKRVHVLRARSARQEWVTLQTGVHALGERIGWLDWRPEEAPRLPLRDWDRGWSRRVVLEAGRAKAIKPMAGPPVLRDVLREYFGGCVAVLVSSKEPVAEAIADLEVVADGLLVRPRCDESADGDRQLLFTVDELARRLRKPRPFSG